MVSFYIASISQLYKERIKEREEKIQRKEQEQRQLGEKEKETRRTT